ARRPPRPAVRARPLRGQRRRLVADPEAIPHGPSLGPRRGVRAPAGRVRAARDTARRSARRAAPAGRHRGAPLLHPRRALDGFRPFLLPPWAPSAAIVAGRIVMALFTAASALVALRLVRCAGALPVDATLTGALALVWLANAAEGTVLRPEQFANAGVLLGIALLAGPPARWRRGTTTAAASLL